MMLMRTPPRTRDFSNIREQQTTPKQSRLDTAQPQHTFSKSRTREYSQQLSKSASRITPVSYSRLTRQPERQQPVTPTRRPQPGRQVQKQFVQASPSQMLKPDTFNNNHTQINTPSKETVRTPTHNRNRSDALLTTGGQHSKCNQVCVNCVNQIIAQKHRKDTEAKKRRQRQEEEQILEEQRMEKQRERELAKTRMQKERIEAERQMHTPAKREAERQRVLQERKRQAQAIEDEIREAREQNMRYLEYEKNRKEQFRKGLQQQMQEKQTEKLKRKELEASRTGPVAGTDGLMGSIGYQREEYSKKILQDYRKELVKQIEQNRQRNWEAQERELRLDKETAATLELAGYPVPKIYEPQIRVTQSNSTALKQQIQNRMQQKRIQRERERQQDEEETKEARIQAQLEAAQEKERREKIYSRYLNDLSKQIEEKKQKRRRDMEERHTGSQQEGWFRENGVAGETKDCGRCHKVYPRSYISTFQYA